MSLELILTHLSVAAGISTVGPFDRRKKAEPRREGEGGIMGALKKTSKLFGLWTLMQSAVAGLRSAYKVTASVFGKSEEDRVVDTAERVTAAVCSELFGDMDTRDFRKELQRYIEQLRPASAEEVKEALSEMLDEVEGKALHEAKEARQVARTAAWWTFGSAVGGGILSTCT